MNSAAIIFCCAVLFVVQRPTTAINCYACTAGTDGCGASTFSKTGAGVFTSVDSSLTYCTKTVYSNNANAAGRAYGSVGTCSTSTSTATTVGVTLTTYCCTTDLCNNAYTRTAGVIFAVMAASLGLFLVK